MDQHSSVEIVDIMDNPEYEKLLIGCIFHRKKKIPLNVLYQTRRERYKYLESSIPKGFHMKVLFWKGDHVGMIEYGPPEAAGLPITGENIIVMNCIWVQRRAQGNGFGKMLINSMEKSEHAAGFATIALEEYWMMWMQKWMMEKLGFRSINSITLEHTNYKKGHCFTAHLMWLPEIEHAKEPTWNESQLLHGVDFCPNHPLYWGRYGCAKLGVRKIYEKCQQ